MALFIKDDDVGMKEWHTGEPLPIINGAVVTFYADGDELAYIVGLIADAPARIKELEDQLSLIDR